MCETQEHTVSSWIRDYTRLLFAQIFRVAEFTPSAIPTLPDNLQLNFNQPLTKLDTNGQPAWKSSLPSTITLSSIPYASFFTFSWTFPSHGWLGRRRPWGYSVDHETVLRRPSLWTFSMQSWTLGLESSLWQTRTSYLWFVRSVWGLWRGSRSLYVAGERFS